MKRAITEIKYITCINDNDINRNFPEYSTFHAGIKYRVIAETDNGVTIVTNSGIISVGKYRFAEYQTKITFKSLRFTKSVINTRTREEAMFLNKYLQFSTGTQLESKFTTSDYCLNLQYNFTTWANKRYFIKEGYKVYTIDQIDFEEFTLPEKWFIKRNTDNYKEINKHFNEKYNTNYTNSSGLVFGNFSYYGWGCGGYYSVARLLEIGYIEITFEQFKKYVLKQDTVKLKEPELPEIKLLGDTVEFIKGSIQFANKTLNKADLEAIKRVSELCSEQELRIIFKEGVISLKDLDTVSKKTINRIATKDINNILKRLK